MLTILVTGSNGQVGCELKSLHRKNQEYNWVFADKSNLDISDKSNIEVFVVKYSIGIIINCAAFTNVELAEDNFELSNLVNNLGVENLSLISKKYKIKLIHLSTDSVFGGDIKMPYKEDSAFDPLNIYSKTKLAGERQLISINPQNSIILRTSWVYSEYGSNFLNTMLRKLSTEDQIGVVCDQIGTPTYAKDLAEVIIKILSQIDNRNVEIYHYSNEGHASWYDFAVEINSIVKTRCKIKKIKTCEYPSRVQRPSYSVLNKGKIVKKFNIDIPVWKTSLQRCLRKMGF